MTHALAAAIAADERAIAEWLTAIGAPDPVEAAARHIRWLQRQGWRKSLALVDDRPPRRTARPEIARAHLAEARAVVEAKRGSRPELEVDR